jgi:hypothetical protein
MLVTLMTLAITIGLRSHDGHLGSIQYADATPKCIGPGPDLAIEDTRLLPL